MEIGASVRFRENQQWISGTIACINDNDVEVVGVDLCEFKISKDSIRLLYPSEDDEDCAPPSFALRDNNNEIMLEIENLQQYGRELFNLTDFEAAGKMYEKILRFITPKLQVGTSVIVLSLDRRSVSAAVISDLSVAGTSADVIYENFDDIQEENDVAIDRIFALSCHSVLHTSSMINLSKCAAKLGAKDIVIHHTSNALVLARYYLSQESDSEGLKRLRSLYVNALHLRAKAHLTMGHIKAATKDCRAMIDACQRDSTNLALANRLLTEIHYREKMLHYENRKLARDVGSWVETSLKRHEGIMSMEVVHDHKEALNEHSQRDNDNVHCSNDSFSGMDQGFYLRFCVVS